MGDVERFWAKVNRSPDGCWLWTGAKKRGGRSLPYGFASFQGKTRLAHRVAWKLAHGAWPQKRVLHSCDNASCVRPDHLRLGTQADNVADMVARGRSTKGRPQPNVCRGSRHRLAKLTETSVRSIREESARGVSKAALARRHGVSERLIKLVVDRISWPHVGPASGVARG